MQDPNVIFIIVKNWLQDKLLSLGFKWMEGEFQSDSFGSSYASIERGNQAYQFVWDGRDTAFYFRACDNIQDYPSKQIWKNLFILSYEKQEQEEEVIDSLIKLANQVLTSLE